MASLLPPAPVGTPFGSFTWADWYEKVRRIINGSLLNHNDLQNIQGGTTSERYHLTQAEYNLARQAMSIKKITRSTITIPAGASSATFTISPALSSLQKATLTYLGCIMDPGAGNDYLPYIQLSNTTTITAFRRSVVTYNTILSFELVEYN